MKKLKTIMGFTLLVSVLVLGAGCSNCEENEDQEQESQVVSEFENSKCIAGSGRVSHIGGGGNDCSSHHRQRRHSTH
ncbi:MAG: hypothetical protein IJ673_05825 [Treponema sp.]|nr:hypothetical protein [Treponema sp.]